MMVAADINMIRGCSPGGSLASDPMLSTETSPASDSTDRNVDAVAHAPMQDHSATGRKRGRDGSESATRSDDSCNSHAVLQPELPAPKRSKQGEAAAQIATLRGHMQGWSAQLHRLQPKCMMDGNLIDHAIVFFIQAVRLRKEMTESGHDYSMTKRSYKELAGACLWLAAKADGSRACLPSRGLMAMGLNVDPMMLADTELELLLAMNWDVFGLLRRAGYRVSDVPPDEA